MNQPFELVSPFAPSGDQPQAIDALVAGLGNGEACQTLLGVTGSGKSIGYDDPLFVVEECGGAHVPAVTAAGPFIDRLMEDGAPAGTPDGETLFLPSERRRFFTMAFDPRTGQSGLYPVSAFIRHKAPEKMYEMRTECGRRVMLTGDHNLWVLRAGALRLIRTTEVKPGDCLPIPESIPAAGERDVLDILPLLRDSPLYVYAVDAVKAFEIEEGAQALVSVFKRNGLSPYPKLSAIRRGLRGQGISVPSFLEILDATIHLGGRGADAEMSVGGKRAACRLPGHLALTPSFIGLLGYYIAEGNAQSRYVVLANRHPVIRHRIEAALRELGLPFAVRSSSDYQVSSRALTELLGRTCGRHAREKRLPSFWPTLSDELLAEMLKAYFDGDGGVEHGGEVVAVTASQQLASDLAYALLRFGIWARVRQVWKRARNSRHEGDWYHRVGISGQPDLTRFAEQIGFNRPDKLAAVRACLGKTENSNVDLVPIDGAGLRWLRSHLGLSIQQLAKEAACSRPAVSLIEAEKRRPSRATLRRLLDALRRIGTSGTVRDLEWERRLAEMETLTRVRWTPIRSVQPVEYGYPYVYDLSVPGPETFLAGWGGLFVHNTFTIANVIQQVQRPTLVLAPNKTLAAQLYSEFRDFFPRNAVEYFVSYYDYYQPEAYVPSSDTYIEKDASINEQIEQMRLSATKALLEREDAIIVATVSAIYGLGDVDAYHSMILHLRQGMNIAQRAILQRLAEMQYTRNDLELHRGTFRVHGDVIDIFPAESEQLAVRVELFGDDVENLSEFDPLTGAVEGKLVRTTIYPSSHYVTPRDTILNAINEIKIELRERVEQLRSVDKLLEAQRLEQRTLYDLEMMREVGYCAGIENYSRYLSGRKPGEPPPTLIDYLPENSLLVIDESHVTVPQLGGMYRGDRARKETLVEYGFRLPSALDNRPLRFDEFERLMPPTIFVSATPGPYELNRCHGVVVDQVVRPTGLMDPEVEVRPVTTQVDDLLSEIRARVAAGERVLVTTLTKRMAEDLTEYLHEHDVRVRYLHSDIETIERAEIIRDLRAGVFDVLVGINLLREGLDLPEVSLVAILDADKEGFLRSTRSLIQTIGRAARHLHGKAMLYADRITDSMRAAIDETERRRQKQKAYNEEHGITPVGVVKAIREIIDGVQQARPAPGRRPERAGKRYLEAAEEEAQYEAMAPDALAKLLNKLEKQMYTHARNLEFEQAAALRDKIHVIRSRKFGVIEGGGSKLG